MASGAGAARLARAAVGAAVPSDQPGLWVEADAVAEPAARQGRAREMAREYRGRRAGHRREARSPRIADVLPASTTPARWPTPRGWSPDLSIERKVELLEELDPEARLELVLAWVRETLAELEVADQIRSRVTDGMDKTQREFLLRQQLAGDPQGAGRRATTTTSSTSTAPS